MGNYYDTVLIGGGRLNIGIFTNFVDAFEPMPKQAQGKRILWLHNGPNLGGPAYDTELSPSPLPFHQSIRQIEASKDFQNWLCQNHQRVIDFIENANDGSREWLEIKNEAGTLSHCQFLEAGNYTEGSLRELRIPRAAFGIYLADKVEEYVSKARGLGITIDFVKGEAEFVASEVSPAGQRHSIKVENGQKMQFPIKQEDKCYATWAETGEAFPSEEISAPTASLGFGMQPNLPHPALDGNENYCRNLYHSGSTVLEMQEKIEKAYALTNKPVSLLIEGAGPAAMDVINWLACQGDVKDKVEITVVSGKSRLRHIVEEPKKEGKTFETVLLSTEYASAEAIFELITKELERGAAEGFSRPETVAGIMPHISPMKAKLSPEVRSSFEENFVAFYLEHLVFDARETVLAWNNFIAQNKLTFTEGYYVLPETAKLLEGGKIAISFKSLDGQKILEQNFNMVANCTGGRIKIGPDSPQLYALVEAGFAKLNPAGTGLQVDEKFQLAPGLFTSGYSIRGSGIDPGLEAIGPAIDKAARVIASAIFVIVMGEQKGLVNLKAQKDGVPSP